MSSTKNISILDNLTNTLEKVEMYSVAGSSAGTAVGGYFAGVNKPKDLAILAGAALIPNFIFKQNQQIGLYATLGGIGLGLYQANKADLLSLALTFGGWYGGALAGAKVAFSTLK